MPIHRRGFLAGAIATGLLTGRHASAQTDYLAELYAKAKTERPVTWYIVYWPSDRAEKHAALFSKAYPGLSVNVVRTTAQVAFQRLSQDIRAGAANCDVFNSTDMSHYVTLKKMGQLLPINRMTRTRSTRAS